MERRGRGAEMQAWIGRDDLYWETLGRHEEDTEFGVCRMPM